MSHQTEVLYLPRGVERHQARCQTCDWRGQPQRKLADAEEDAACHEIAADEPRAPSNGGRA